MTTTNTANLSDNGKNDKNDTTTSHQSPMDMKPMSTQDLTATPAFRMACWLMQTFATVGRRSPPPSNSNAIHIRLIAISVSPYVEKVRWGLDLLERASTDSAVHYYYTEDCHPPGGCAFYTTQASHDRASQSPMIVMEDNNDTENESVVLWGSDVILQHFFLHNNHNNHNTPNLYPSEIQDEIVKLEADLGVRLGASARCFAYNALLATGTKYYPAAIRALCRHSPWIEKLLFGVLLYQGKVKERLSEQLQAFDPHVVEHSKQEIRQVFTEVSFKLEQTKAALSKGDGNDDDEDDVYIMDTPTKRYGFTAADLTFCALVYHLIRPPQLHTWHIPLDELPPQIEQFRQELLATTAGQHVLRVYQRHRPVDPTTNEIVMRTVNQNRIPWVGLLASSGVVMAVLGMACHGMLGSGGGGGVATAF